MARGIFCAKLGVRLRERLRVSRKREMGKLSSFFRGWWRAGWLALIISLAALLVVGDHAGAKPRRDRFNDNPWNKTARATTMPTARAAVQTQVRAVPPAARAVAQATPARDPRTRTATTRTIRTIRTPAPKTTMMMMTAAPPRRPPRKKMLASRKPRRVAARAKTTTPIRRKP